jgi:multiple sugar transport system substrate-binding protein
MNITITGRCFRTGLTAFIGILVLLSGCNTDHGKRETVTFWAMGREGESVRMLIPPFEREHPEISVKVQTLPWTGAHQKLLTAFAGDSTPDLCQLGNTWIPELAAVGALMPLGPMVNVSDAVKPDDYFPGIWDTNLIGDTLYGVPWYVDTRLIFYRRDLLAKAGFDHPPRNWAEWEHQLTAIKAMAGPSRYSILLPLNEFEPLVSFGLQQAEPLLRDGGRYGNFESAGFKDALNFYVNIFRNGWAPLAANTQISNVWTEFARGFFSFYVSGPWNIAEFKARLPEDLRDAWATATLPGPNGPGASIAGGSSLVIFNSSPHKLAAWRLIEYLSRAEVQSRFYELVGDLPPRRMSWENPIFTNDPYTAAFREQLERARPTPKVPEWERIATEIRLIGEQLAHGELSVNEAAADLDGRTNVILAKRRWMLDRRRANLQVFYNGLTFFLASPSGMRERT